MASSVSSILYVEIGFVSQKALALLLEDLQADGLGMASEKQIEANRRNGKRSIGPRTPAGKAASAKNALKHGLLSREVLLPEEDAQAFARLGRRLGEALDPVGELELVLADRILGLLWRLRRLGKIEAGILAWQRVGVLLDRAYEKERRQDLRAIGKMIARDRREWEKARAEQDQLESKQYLDLPTWGGVFIRDSSKENALSKLSRYDTSLERSLYKALHELQRLQAVRQGKEVAVPIALDIDVSGTEPPAGERRVMEQLSDAAD